jgi:hypothetical protein
VFQTAQSGSIVNCTFVGNANYGLFKHGFGAGVPVVNCIFWSNGPDQIGGDAPAPTVTYSDVEGGWSGPGADNIDIDPDFVADLSGSWTSDPIYDAADDVTVLTDDDTDLVPDGLVGRLIIPNTSLDFLQTVVLTNTATTITIMGDIWPAVVSAGDTYVIRDEHITAASPCIDAADNTAVPEDATTDLDGNPRFLEIPETPDTGNGDVPIVDMGAYESLGGGCLAIVSQEVVCHGDGTTFTVNAEGLDACTGGTTMVSFTGTGGAVGEPFCATLLVNTEGGGFCCSTQLCVPVPDCSAAALPCGLDHDGEVGITDFLLLLGAWGPCLDCTDCPPDLDGDCAVGVTDLLVLLANWGPCL